MEAIEAWHEARLGRSWYATVVEDSAGAPFVHIEMDFRTPLRPGDELETTVTVEKVGRSSLTTAVVGRRGDGEVSFTGRFVQVFVKRPELVPVEIPAAFRAAAEREVAPDS